LTDQFSDKKRRNFENQEISEAHIMRTKKFNFIPAIFGLWFLMGPSFHTSVQSQAAAQLQKSFQHNVLDVNIEVPVRVFKGDMFIDSLTIDDFEVFEDGKPQQLEGLFLIKKIDIKREEGNKEIKPAVARHFVFLLEMTEYLPELGTAMDYFLDHVILPDDSFEVFTPIKGYKMKSHVFESIPKEKVKEQLKEILHRDIVGGASEYRNILRELQVCLKESNFGDYGRYLKQLERLRKVNQESMISFAQDLKKKDGQKHVFLFYQQEVLPKLKPKVDGSELVSLMIEGLGSDKKNARFDVGAVKKAYSDASTSLHFLFIAKTLMTSSDVTETGLDNTKINTSGYDPSGDIIMGERSEDIFSAFNEISPATGGISTRSVNAEAAFKMAANALENYYLIYYRPLDYKADEQFHEIKVMVKSGNYGITHRAGYIAK
jgi:hypothetical protein